MYHGRDLFVLVFRILLRVFLHFVARFVVIVSFTRIRSKCADIKTLHPTSVAAVFFLFLCYFSGRRESKGVKLQIYFFLGRET